MARYMVDEKGVNALKACAAALSEEVEKIQTASDRLKSAFDERKEVLGPHAFLIADILEQVEPGSESLTLLQANLLKAASRLQYIINLEF